MAHSLSAKKRVRQNAKSRARNRWRKDRYRTAIRDFRETVLHGSADDAETKLKGLYKLLDQIAATGTIHKNTASRLKGRLAASLNRKRTPAKAA